MSDKILVGSVFRASQNDSTIIKTQHANNLEAIRESCLPHWLHHQPIGANMDLSSLLHMSVLRKQQGWSMLTNLKSDSTRPPKQALGNSQLAFLAASLLIGISTAGSAGSHEQSEDKELYKLKATAPDQALSDTVYRYLSERAAAAYANKHFKEAELLYSSALTNAEKAHATACDVAILTANLASVYRDSSQFDRAKLLFSKALQSSSNQGGDTYKYVLRQYALFLERTGRTEEAKFTFDAARHGHKLVPGSGTLANQSARRGGDRSPVLLIQHTPLAAVPTTNQNDPYLDVSLPLPEQLSAGGRPWTFHLQFAECPPRERWSAFDTEQRSTLNREWADWLKKMKNALESAIVESPDLPKQGRYHLVVTRSGCINNVETLSNPAFSEDYLQSIGAAISRLNNCTSVSFPDRSHMEEIHVVLNFEKPEPDKPEVDWSQFKPQVSNGYTVIYPIAGAGWVGRPWYSYPQSATGQGAQAPARPNSIQPTLAGTLSGPVPQNTAATLPINAAQPIAPRSALNGLPPAVLNPLNIPGVLLPGRPPTGK
jgi:tetratricopeptide (TPR) repeat protein